MKSRKEYNMKLLRRTFSLTCKDPKRLLRQLTEQAQKHFYLAFVTDDTVTLSPQNHFLYKNCFVPNITLQASADSVYCTIKARRGFVFIPLVFLAICTLMQIGLIFTMITEQWFAFPALLPTVIMLIFILFCGIGFKISFDHAEKLLKEYM